MLQRYASCCVALQQKCLGKLALAAELERAEVFEPWPFGDIRLQIDPDSQFVQVFKTDVAVVHTFDEMVAEGGGKARPAFDLLHGSPIK
jgi:hypothetical protein